MPKYEVQGYDKTTGEKRTIIVEASTVRHAKTVAYDKLTYPKVLGKV